MKILYVATDVVVPSDKGSSTHTIEVSSSLSLLGNEVHVLSRRKSREQVPTESIRGAIFHRIFRGLALPLEMRHRRTSSSGRRRSSLIGFFHDVFLSLIHAPFCAFLAIQIIRREKVDVILERGSSLGAGGLASLLSGKPMVLEIIDYRHSRLSIKVARKTIAYRPDIPKSNIPPHLLRIVPAGANTEMFVEGKQSPEIDLVGYVGSFRPWHGVDDLVKAARILKDGGQVAQFIMVGPGYESTMDLARNLGISDLFTFMGGLPYEQIPTILERCGIVVAPFDPSKDSYMSEHGFIFSPLKIFEYMSMAKAVVTSDVEKVREIVNDHRNGLLVDPGSPDQLADRIEELIMNPALAVRMGKRARADIVARYSWARLSSMILRTLIKATQIQSSLEVK